jgi:hypothetical protein
MSFPSLTGIRFVGLGLALFIVLVLSLPPPSLQDDKIYEKMADKLFHGMQDALNHPLNEANASCKPLNDGFMKPYAKYKVYSDRELRDLFSSTKGLKDGLVAYEQLNKWTVKVKELVCDFTAKPQLACNKDSKCEACSDENKKKDSTLKGSCDFVKNYANIKKGSAGQGSLGNRNWVPAVTIICFTVAAISLLS